MIKDKTLESWGESQEVGNIKGGPAGWEYGIYISVASRLSRDWDPRFLSGPICFMLVSAHWGYTPHVSEY